MLDLAVNEELHIVFGSLWEGSNAGLVRSVVMNTSKIGKKCIVPNGKKVFRFNEYPIMRQGKHSIWNKVSSAEHILKQHR